MSAPRRQILTDYLRLLRPLRALRAMIGLLKQAVTYFTGEAATPLLFPFGELHKDKVLTTLTDSTNLTGRNPKVFSQFFCSLGR